MNPPTTPTPPPTRSECDPEFPSPPTAKVYFVRNKKRPFTNFIRAEITPIGYFLYHVENTPDDGLGCPGSWLVDLAWTHFVQSGVSINGIRESWTFGANLKTINDLTQNNAMTIAEAATHTWAFKQASGKGFASVDVLDSHGSPGNYTAVDVVFLP